MNVKGGNDVVIGGNGDRIYERLMVAIGREDLAFDPKYATNQGRADHVEMIDKAIEDWTKQHHLEDVQRKLDQASVPVGPIYGIEDIVADKHYQAREMLRKVELPDGNSVLVPGVVPKLSETPGDLEWVGPTLGEHNDQVYSEYLDFSFDDFIRLKEEGII